MRTKIEQETSEHPVASPDADTAASRHQDQEVRWARRQALRATLAMLLPFLLAVAVGVGQRIYGVYGATAELRDLAVRTVPQGGGPSETINELAHRLAVEVYGERHDEDVVSRYESLVRVVAKEMGRLPEADRVEQFERRAGAMLLRGSVSPVALQAILVLFFPALFISGFWRAAQGIRQGSALNRFPTFAGYVWYQRYRRLLQQQENWFFWRRAGFAFLMGYGSLYLVAPLGVKAMVFGDYLTRNAIPGEVTYPFLLTAFEKAPPFSVGFAGFYLYALTLFVRRYTTHDLNDRIFVPLFLRGITVALLGWVLTSIGEEGGLSRVLVFAAGIFPTAGLQAIAKVTQTTVDRLSDEGSSAFKTIPEIDFWKETTLQEAGINDFNDLAKANLDQLLFDLGMNPAVLLRAVDRAILIHVLGAEAAAKLAALPLHTASDLVFYTRGRNAWEGRWRALGIQPRFPMGSPLTEEEQRGRVDLVEETLGAKDLCVQLEHLEHDRNVRMVIDNLVSYESL